jgi:hypothetical protein
MNWVAKTVSAGLVSGLLLARGSALGAPAASARVKAAPPAPAASSSATVADNDDTAPPGSSPAPGSTPAAPLQLDAPTFDEPGSEEALDPYTRIRDLEVRLEQTRSVIVGQKPRLTLSGYIDGGFFVPQGDGAGIVRDNGNTLFPQYAGKYGWVFLGDILSTAVNSRGEVADLGDATGAPPRFDSIHSRGAPGFVANEINLTLNSALGQNALATASVDFMPRSGSNFSLGDFMEVDIAQIEWMPTRTQRTSIFFGKTDSLIGIEYRERKSNQRFGITPSLIARYTTGPALGIKVRSKFGADDLLVVAGAVTNGSNTVEQFHFYDEIDTNAGKTASGRVSLHPPIPLDVELGVSGSYGSQDLARDSRGAMWFAGVDFTAHINSLDFKAQVLKGAAPGRAIDDAYGLELHKGGYAEVDWMATPIFGFLGRAELRDAFVWLGDATSDPGANRAYLTKSWRGVGGVRVAFSDRVVFKAEYLRNGEYGGIPEIKNDVFTTSLLLIN